jgi:hypothetical protein
MRKEGASAAYERGPQLVGRRYGDWLVIEGEGYYGPRHRLYRVTCVRCLREEVEPVYELRRLDPCGCGKRPRAVPPQPRGVDVDSWTPWEQDDRAWYAVSMHPEGLTQGEVGLLMGITEDRVQQIEAAALRKLRDEHGDDLGRLLAELQG